MVDAFKGQDAVILSLAYPIAHRRAALAEASKKAGVKRLIASGWGGNNANQEAQDIFPLAAMAAKDVKALEAMETPEWTWTSICCGLFF
jgi:hypothetical protein